MVRKTFNRSRVAFTMIELIFAIVIIAISVLSLPMMINTVDKGIENNIAQEAIFAAYAEIMGATTGYWDENSMQDELISDISRVIDISNSCENNVSSTRFGLKPGHIAQPFHRRCLANLATSASNTAGGLFIDLDDAEKTNQDLFMDTSGAVLHSGASGYKKLYKVDINVSVSVGNADVKIITATIKDGVKIVTVLKAQSANIGEIDFYKRMF